MEPKKYYANSSESRGKKDKQINKQKPQKTPITTKMKNGRLKSNHSNIGMKYKEFKYKWKGGLSDWNKDYDSNIDHV
jgi:hypothetical protein